MNSPVHSSQSFVAPLGNLSHLGFCAYAPHMQLQDWVQCYWSAHCEAIPPQGFTEKLYPDGGTTLTFYFIQGQLPQILFDARHDLTSQHFQGSINNIGIRFHPPAPFNYSVNKWLLLWAMNYLRQTCLCST